jgi:hypothetical protein
LHERINPETRAYRSALTQYDIIAEINGSRAWNGNPKPSQLPAAGFLEDDK